MRKKNKMITILLIIISIFCGIMTHDYYIGTVILICGLLNSYYASIKKNYNYIFGALYYIFTSYVYFKNSLYGLTFLSLFIYFPSQIQGYLSWNNKINKKNEVIVRNFNLKNSIIVILSCILGSFILGLLLNFIPTQQMAFLDSSSNILSLCVIILMNLRFKEYWIILLFNNTVDLIIWIIKTMNHAPNSSMMLIVSIGYLLINFYGIYKWYKLKKIIKKYI